MIQEKYDASGGSSYKWNNTRFLNNIKAQHLPVFTIYVICGLYACDILLSSVN